MDNIHLNHWAVFACASINLLIGGLWYSPMLFYKAWLKETGLDEDRLSDANPARLYGTAFLLALVMAYNLAFFLGDAQTDWKWGLTAGFLAGFGWASLAFALIGLFERRTLKYVLINGGYITTWFTLSGLLLGLWR